MSLTKLINNGATFCYTRIVSLYALDWGYAVKGEPGVQLVELEPTKKCGASWRLTRINVMLERFPFIATAHGQRRPDWRETCSPYIVSYSYTL